MEQGRALKAGRAGGSGGFTLVELLVAVAVLAIVLTIAIPSFASIAQRARLKSAADKLRSELSEARTEALRRNRNVVVSFTRSTDGATWCYGFTLNDSGCDCSQTNPGAADYCFVDVNGSTPIRRVVSSSDYAGVSLSASTITGDRLRFSSVRPTLDAGSVTFTSSGGDSVRVTASNFGRLRLCSPAGDTYYGAYPAC